MADLLRNSEPLSDFSAFVFVSKLRGGCSASGVESIRRVESASEVNHARFSAKVPAARRAPISDTIPIIEFPRTRKSRWFEGFTEGDWDSIETRRIF